MKPIEFGGLGILDLEKFSRALRLRWLWYAWAEPHKAWLGTTLPIDDVDAALFAAATTISLRNGQKALFWHSSWAHGRPLLLRFPLLYGHSRRKNRTVHDAIQNGKWIKDIAYSLNNDLLVEFFGLWNVLQSLKLNLDTPEEDQICWKLDPSGKYTAKSAYNIQFSGCILSNFPRLIWKAWAPPKCKFFLWLLLQDRLWTAARLQVRGLENNYFCGLCVRNLETITHLFIDCPFSRTVWDRIATWSNCNNLQPVQWGETRDVEDWFLVMIDRGSKKGHTLAILTLWCIWNRRNAAVFNNKTCTAEQVFGQISEEAFLWANAGGKALRSLFVGHNFGRI